MKLIITLAKDSNRNALGRLSRVCKDFHIRLEAPVWADNNICEMRLHASSLSDNLLDALSEVCEDADVEDAFLKAA